MSALRCFLLGLSLSLASAPSAHAQSTAQAGSCGADLEILWNDEPRTGEGLMGFSLRGQGTQEQLGGLPISSLSLNLGTGSSTANLISLSQARPDEARRDGLPADLFDDPVRYDAFFAVDLSRSMDRATKGPDGAERSRRELAVSLIQRIAVPSEDGSASLLDEKDRLFISGFDDRVYRKSSALDSDRSALRPALAELLEHSPASENTALYAAISDSLNLIRQTRSSGSGPRESILFVITDSFNGRDLAARSNITSCRANDEPLKLLMEQIQALSSGDSRGVRLFILALGEDKLIKGYSPEAGPSRSCRPTTVQKKTVDGHSFRTLTGENGAEGGTIASEDEEDLFTFIQEDFDARWMPYQLRYNLGANHAPSSYSLVVKRPEGSCEAVIRSSGDIVPPIVRGTTEGPSSAEMALVLASLMLSLLFVPRAFTNLGEALRSRRKS